MSLVLAGGAFAGSADRQDHYLYRTPGGAIHCYITVHDGDNEPKPGGFTGFANCSTRTLVKGGRHAEIYLQEDYRPYVVVPGGEPIDMVGGTTLRPGRTYRFKYPWRTGRTMFWVTVRRTARMESLRVRNTDGHGFLLRVQKPSYRTTLVKF